MHRKAGTTVFLAFILMGIAGCSRTVEDVAKWQSNENTEKLIEALSDPKEEVRAAAATALGELKDETAIDDLAACFNGEGESVLLASLDALAAIGGDAVTTPMIAALTLDNAAARIKAADALGALGVSSAVEPLAAALEDPDPSVQLAAIKAIGKIGASRDNSATALKALLNALANENKGIHDAATASLVRIGSPAIPQMLEALRSNEPRVRRGAIALLRGLCAIPAKGDDLVWYQLARSSLDDSEGIDPETIEILAKQGETAIVPLLDAASRPYPGFREHASVALERIGEPCIRKTMAMVSAKANTAAKAWLAERSDWCGAPSPFLDLWGAVAALDPQFEIDKSRVATLKARGGNATRTLSASEFKTTRADIPRLVLLLDDEINGELAKKRLADAGHKATLPLIAAIGGDNATIAEQAADVIADLADKRAYQPLANALQDRLDAGEPLSDSPLYKALLKLDMPEAEPLLLKVRPNSDRAIRVLERQYRNTRIVGAGTPDPYTDNEAPVSFHLAYVKNGRHGELEVTFKKDRNGDWRPSPALPYKLP